MGNAAVGAHGAQLLLSAGSECDLTLIADDAPFRRAGGLPLTVDVSSYGAPGPLRAPTPMSNLGQAAVHQSTTDLLKHSLGKPAAGSDAGSALRSVALRAVGFCPDVSEFGEVYANFEAVRARLPDEAVAQLMGITQQVDSAANEAAAAEAALQAVAQVMSARQKAAEAARQRAVDAVSKLKGHMADFLASHSAEKGAEAERLDMPQSQQHAKAAASAGLGIPGLSLPLLSMPTLGGGCGMNSVGNTPKCGLGSWGPAMEMDGLADLGGHMLDLGGSISGDFGAASLLHQMDYVNGFGGVPLTEMMIEVNN